MTVISKSTLRRHAVTSRKARISKLQAHRAVLTDLATEHRKIADALHDTIVVLEDELKRLMLEEPKK